MNNLISEDYLMHYGIKGMKWGVRRFQNYDGTRIKGAAKGYAKSAGNLVKTQASRRVKNNEYSTYRRSKTMTDKELRDANKRYQLEKQYRDNVRNDRRDGMTAVERIFDKGGSIFASAAIGAAAGGAGAMIGKKILAKSASKVLAHDDLTSEDYLMHYGVKGMKWGVRNDPQPTGRMRRRAANQQYRQSVKAAGRRNIQAFRENYGSREARRSANQQFRSEVNAAKQKNREAFKLSDKQKKILKGTAIAAGVIAAAGIGTIAASNIRITNSAKKEVMTALKRTGSARVSEVLTNHNDSFVKNGEAAKFLHDKNLKESAKAVSNYHKRQIEKINTNANKIIERHEQSVPKKEINKEARSLVKEWRDVGRQNRKISRANNKLWKQYKRGKIDSKQYYSMFKPYKQRSNYKTPTNWYKYYPNDWI